MARYAHGLVWVCRGSEGEYGLPSPSEWQTRHDSAFSLDPDENKSMATMRDVCRDSPFRATGIFTV